MNIKKNALILDNAAYERQPVNQLSTMHHFTLDQAYAIQAESIKRRVKRGERITGIKMGFTSHAKMEQMGVHDMIWGVLTDGMHIDNGSIISIDRFIHPRAEPEICFITSEAIDREINMDEVQDFIGQMAPAIEIIDSRFRNFKFSLEDVIADNCSSSGYIIGDAQHFQQDIDKLAIEFWINDELVHKGSSTAILGNPVVSIIHASRLTAQYNFVIPRGAIILAGAATPAEYVKAGDQVTVSIERLGCVGFSAGGAEAEE